MSKAGDLKPLEKRIIEILNEAGERWLTRLQIAKLLGRPGRVQPNDIAALDRLSALELIESRETIRGAVATQWEYHIKKG